MMTISTSTTNLRGPGTSVLSPAMAKLFVSIERRLARGEDVPSHEFSAVLFACCAGPFGDFHVAKVTA